MVRISPYPSTDIVPGSRLQLLSDEFVRNADGQATVVCSLGREGRYRVKLDSGKEKLLRLDCEHFRLLRYVAGHAVGRYDLLLDEKGRLI